MKERFRNREPYQAVRYVNMSVLLSCVMMKADANPVIRVDALENQSIPQFLRQICILILLDDERKMKPVNIRR